MIVALVLAAFQGPQYTASLVRGGIDPNDDRWRWNQDLTAPQDRVSTRGFPSEREAPPGRLAIWPGSAYDMRLRRAASTDFADAGYPVVTAWTKQRTMRGLVEPNDELENRSRIGEAVCEVPLILECDGAWPVHIRGGMQVARFGVDARDAVSRQRTLEDDISALTKIARDIRGSP